MNKDILIRPLRSKDSAALASLEIKCPGAAQWGEEGFQLLGQGGLQGWAAESEGFLVGFVLIRVVADELEILNLAVEQAARRQGIASRLVCEAINRGKGLAAKRAYLEVRESNAAALEFYSLIGFVETSRRKTYYSQPVEDAIILVRDIG